MLTIAVSEEAITVDRSPPIAGTVNDGAEVGTDADYTDSTSQLCVNWEGFSDAESGISAIQWSIGKITEMIHTYIYIEAVFIAITL